MKELIQAMVAFTLMCAMLAVVLFARHMDVIAVVMQSAIASLGHVLQLGLVLGALLWLIYMFFGFIEKLPDMASKLRPNETHYHDNRQLNVHTPPNHIEDSSTWNIEGAENGNYDIVNAGHRRNVVNWPARMHHRG